MKTFNINYKKSSSAEPKLYKNVSICGSFGSEEEGSNIGYQALMPECEGEKAYPRRFKYDKIEWMTLSN
jgi:hypothetical protein